jgi:hypothetical protein
LEQPAVKSICATGGWGRLLLAETQTVSKPDFWW